MTNTSPDRVSWALALAAKADAAGVAESHGLITGLIAGRPSLGVDELLLHWMALNLDTEPSRPTSEDPLAEHQRHLTQALETVHGELTSPELAFELLIPSVDQPLSQQTEGLAQWCSGFLAGFGASCGSVVDSEGEEALQLISEIARADSTAVDEDNQDLDGDAHALMELVEFVRVAVLLLFQEQSQRFESMEATAGDERKTD